MDLKQRIEQLRKEARSADREDKHRAEIFEAWTKTEGWKLYVALLTKKLEALGADLVQPSVGVEGVLNSEFQKGMMFAFMLCRDLPSVEIAAIAAMKPTTEEEE